MTLNIKYFGMLAELTGCDSETLSFSKGTIFDLMGELFIKYPLLKEKEFQVAQNKIIVSKNTEVSNTEIALLPPFAGG